MDPKFGTASLCALKAGMNLLGSQDVTFFWWRYSMKILLISPEVTHFPPQRSEAGQLARTWLGFGILEIDAWKGCQERVADLKKRDPKQYGWKALEHSTATGSAQGRGKSSKHHQTNKAMTWPL